MTRRARSLGRVMISGVVWGPAGGVLAVVVIFAAAAVIPGIPGGKQNGGVVGYAVAAGAVWGLLSGVASAGAGIALGKLIAVLRGRAAYGLFVGSAVVSFALTSWFFEQILAAPLGPSLLVGGVAAVFAAFIVLSTWAAGSPVEWLRVAIGRQRVGKA